MAIWGDFQGVIGVTRGGRGVKKDEIWGDVIYGWSLSLKRPISQNVCEPSLAFSEAKQCPINALGIFFPFLNFHSPFFTNKISTVSRMSLVLAPPEIQNSPLGKTAPDA